MNKSTLQAGALILTGVAMVSYTFTRYFENKYDPNVGLETQKVYKQLSVEDQSRLKTLMPVLNAGLVREKGFWEKKAYHEMRKTSQAEFEATVQKAVVFDKQCEVVGKHLNKVDKPYYFEWQATEMSCG